MYVDKRESEKLRFKACLGSVVKCDSIKIRRFSQISWIFDPTFTLRAFRNLTTEPSQLLRRCRLRSFFFVLSSREVKITPNTGIYSSSHLFRSSLTGCNAYNESIHSTCQVFSNETFFCMLSFPAYAHSMSINFLPENNPMLEARVDVRNIYNLIPPLFILQ